MIVNITKGKSARGGLAYDYGPGNKEEHENPRRVAGNVPGKTYQQRASRFDRAQKSYTQQTGRTPKQPVVRMAVSANPEDAKMSDRQWGQIAHQTVDRFTGGKADQYPWEAVRHDDGHIHITLSRCGTDGKLLTSSNDYRRAQAIGREIEQRYGLTETKNRTLGKSASKVADRGRADDRTGQFDTDRANARTTEGRSVSVARDRDQRPDQRQGGYEMDSRTAREIDRPYELRGTETLDEEQRIKESAAGEMGGRAQSNDQTRQAGRGGDRHEQQHGRAARDPDRGSRQSGQGKGLDRDSMARIYADTKPGSPERRQAIQEARRQQSSEHRADNTQDRQQEQQRRDRGRER